MLKYKHIKILKINLQKKYIKNESKYDYKRRRY